MCPGQVVADTLREIRVRSCNQAISRAVKVCERRRPGYGGVPPDLVWYYGIRLAPDAHGEGSPPEGCFRSCDGMPYPDLALSVRAAGRTPAGLVVQHHEPQPRPATFNCEVPHVPLTC